MDMAREAMMNHSRADRPPPSNAQLRSELDLAGSLEAGRVIAECMRGASSTEKVACATSVEVREAIATATGRNSSSFSDRDLIKFADRSAKSAATKFMMDCRRNATGDEAAMRACMDGLKDEIARKGGRKNVSSSDAMRVLREGAEDSLTEFLRGCDRSGQDCKESARSALAAAKGMNPESVSDFELKARAKHAAESYMHGILKSCLQVAENKTRETIQACRDEAKSALKEASLGGLEPSKAEFLRGLDRAALAEAREAREQCGEDEAACLEDLRSRLVAMGQEGNITDEELVRLSREGAMEASQEELLACREAGEQAAGECVKNAIAKYRRLKGGRKPPRSERAHDVKSEWEMAKALEEGRRDACYSEGSNRDDITACLEEASEVEDALGDIFRDQPDDKKARCKKRSAKDADVSIIGRRYQSCRKSASSEQERSSCENEATTLTDKTDVGEDSEKVLKRYRAQSIATSVKDCNATRKKECRARGRSQMAEELGFKPREYAMMRKLGMLKHLAEEWAACVEAGSEDSTCETEAEAEFVDFTGADAQHFAEVKMKVETLATAIVNGFLTKFVKLRKLLVDIGTTGANCVPAIGTAIAAQLESTAANVSVLENITAQLCQLNDGLPLHPFTFDAPSGDDSTIEAAAEIIADNMEGSSITGGARRLGERRLSESVSEANAAQGIDEIVVTDSPTPSPNKKDTNRAVGGISSLGVTAFVLAAVLLLRAETA